ncbi:MAG TPA: 3'-5' exonuclease [Cyclobacteriaceae bacterium]|nr:3'-5' exonuclease [Cyclobacteriaceae bacterium]
MNPEIRDVVFLDIETVASTNQYQSLDERFKSLWARKAVYLRRSQEETDEYLFENRAGIYAEFGKIICIVVGKFVENDQGELALRTKAYSGEDERQLLLNFKSMIERLDPLLTRFCAHNGKEFDYPFLCRRMLVNDIPLPALLNLSGKKPWDVQHLDTLEMWKFGDVKHYTSLDLLASIFNLPSSKGAMDGSQVNRVYYEEKDLEKITDYCVSDVVVLARLFLKLKCVSLEKELSVQQAN